MSNKEARIRRVFGVMAIMMTGILNPWVVGMVLSKDGRIDDLVPFVYIVGIAIFLVLLGVALLLPVGSKANRVSVWGAMLLILVISVEIGAQIGHKVLMGKLSYRKTGHYPGLFEPHPYLVGAPRPGARYEREGLVFSHNEFGFRGLAPDAVKERLRVVTIGGSSTYGAGVSDSDTWQVRLEEMNDHLEVLNLGVLGYSTAEHVVQTALQIRRFQPDIALFYVGWNDLRNSHVPELKSDYSGFHGPSQYTNLNLPHRVWLGLPFAAPILFTRILQNFEQVYQFPWVARSPNAELGEGVDERALGIYRQNLISIVELCKAQGIKPLFVPQIMNLEFLRDNDSVNPWIPGLQYRDVPAVLTKYNETLVDVGRERRVLVAKHVQPELFEEKDFIDEGHFSIRGNQKFASMLKSVLQR